MSPFFKRMEDEDVEARARPRAGRLILGPRHHHPTHPHIQVARGSSPGVLRRLTPMTASSREKAREDLSRAFSTPDIDEARKHARAYLPHMPNGDLLPINCPMSCFKVKGAPHSPHTR